MRRYSQRRTVMPTDEQIKAWLGENGYTIPDGIAPRTTLRRLAIAEIRLAEARRLIEKMIVPGDSDGVTIHALDFLAETETR